MAVKLSAKKLRQCSYCEAQVERTHFLEIVECPKCKRTRKMFYMRQMRAKKKAERLAKGG